MYLDFIKLAPEALAVGKKPISGRAAAHGRRLRGQSSMENMIMLGMGLSVALVFFYFSAGMLDESIQGAQAKDAVNRIAREVDYVQALAPGTARYVDFTIPQGAQLIEITERRVHMQLSLRGGLTDFYANTQEDMVGKITLQPGPARALVKHLESGNVLVGNKELSLEPMLLEFYLQRATGADGRINVTNAGAGDRNLTGIHAYVLGDIAGFVEITQPAGELALWENSSIDVTVSIPPDTPFGNYYGSIMANSSEGSWDETAVNIIVRGGAPQSCTLNPPSANLSLESTQAFESSCYDSVGYGTSCPNLEWSSDAGAMIPPQSPTVSTMYVDKIGTYVSAGYGVFNCSASVFYPDPYGPAVTGLSFYPPTPMNLTEGLDISVNATGDDTATGGHMIKTCRVNVDWGAWAAMDPVDGAYDSSVENVEKGIGGNFTSGWHTIYVQCQDDYNNWGAVSQTDFYLSDRRGPVVTAIYLDHTPICALEIATVYADVRDYEEATIIGCQYSADGGPWEEMDPKDGGFDSATETGRYYESGGFSAGPHTLSAKCTDQYDNTGPTKNVSINASTCNPELFDNPSFDYYMNFLNYALWFNWWEDRFFAGVLIPEDGRTGAGTSIMMGNGELYQPVSVQKNTNYTVKVWTRSTKPLTAPLQIGVRDNNGYWLQQGGNWNTSEYFFVYNLTSSWAQKQMTFVTRDSSSVNSVRVNFHMDSTSGYVFIDDASMRRT
jgi:hypothetical protein